MSATKIKVYAPRNANAKLIDWLGDDYDFVITHGISYADMVLLPPGIDVEPKLYGDTEIASTTSSSWVDQQDLKAINEALEDGMPIIGISRGAQMLTVAAGGKLIQKVPDHIRRQPLPPDATYVRKMPVIEGYKHYVRFMDDTYGYVTSAHSQLMHPFCLGREQYKMIAWRRKFEAEDSDTTYITGDNFTLKPSSEFDYFLPDEKKNVKEHFLVNVKSTDDKPKVMPLAAVYGKLTLMEPEIVEYPLLRGLAIQFHPEKMEDEKPTLNKVRSITKKFIQDNL